MKHTVSYALPIKVRGGFTTVDQLDTPHIIAKFKRALSVWRNKQRARYNCLVAGKKEEAAERLVIIHEIEDQLLLLKHAYMIRVSGYSDFHKLMFDLDPENIIEVVGFEVKFEFAEYKYEGSKDSAPIEATPESFTVAEYKTPNTCNTPLSRGSSASLLAVQATG